PQFVPEQASAEGRITVSRLLRRRKGESFDACAPRVCESHAHVDIAETRRDMSNDNAELLRGTYEAFGRGDIPAVIGVLDENIVWNAPAVLPHAMTVSGRADVGAFFQKLAATWQDFNVQADHFVASGDRVCVVG